jgi:hypothetical protein
VKSLQEGKVSNDGDGNVKWLWIRTRCTIVEMLHEAARGCMALGPANLSLIATS